MRYIIGYIGIILLFFCTNLAAQTQAVNYHHLVEDLERVLAKGNKRTLRDLGSLLDKKGIDHKIRNILDKYTLFTASAIDIQKISRADFLSFFYDNEKQFQYSELFGAFYLVPLENRSLHQDSLFIIPDNLPVPPIFSTNCSTNNTATPDSLIFRNLLQERNLNIKNKHCLELLTNTPIPSHIPTHSYYQHLLDSLGSLAAIRLHAYEESVHFKRIFFYEPINFYGKIFCTVPPQSILHTNAFKDMLAAKHPRILFYLAAYIYKYRTELDSNKLQSYIEALQFLTQVDLHASFDMKNKPGLVHFLTYWAQHYMDYEWDVYQNKLLNKAKHQALNNYYEKQFRRLNSTSETAAWEAYLALAKGDPQYIIPLAKKYRSLLRNIHPQLPELKYAYLENIAQLTTFCDKHHIAYESPAYLKDLLTVLDTTNNPRLRYQTENTIIKQVDLTTVSALEYQALLKVKNKDFSLSIGRILNWYYSQNWELIIQQPDALRLYLKKAHLFKAIDCLGMANHYLQRFDKEDSTTKHYLNNLLQIENDAMIIAQIQEVLQEKPNAVKDTNTDAIIFEKFIQAPASFSTKQIQQISAPSIAQRKSIFKLLKKQKDTLITTALLEYLVVHPNVEDVPALFRFVEKNACNPSTCEQVVYPKTSIILAKIYAYQFPDSSIEAWQKQWKNHTKNYKNWGVFFIEKSIKDLQQKESIKIKELNAITTALFYNEKYKISCLKLLPKVTPAKAVRQLKMPNLLPLSDLQYFESLNLNHKQWDDIPKLFDIQSASILADFLVQRIADFPLNEQAVFYNSMLKAVWFKDYILKDQKASALANTIKNTLKKYLKESDYLSEFEEQRSLLHLTQIDCIGKSLSKKLDATLGLDLGKRLKANIQQTIISQIEYKDIGIVLQVLPYLSHSNGQAADHFLSRNFGLPLFHLTEAQLKKLRIQHQTLNQYDFYWKQLQAFGVDFLTDSKQLDFQKIDHILALDLVEPFASNSSYRRDWYVYGIIKLLELHFQTRLGFHEKLNEGQDFYTFTAHKRAAAWRLYLKSILVF